MTKVHSPKEFEKLQQEINKKRKPDKPMVIACGGTGCNALGCKKVAAAFQDQLSNLNGDVELRISGCQGFCERGPIVLISPQDIFYEKVQEADVPEIIEKTIQKGEIIERLCHKKIGTDDIYNYENEIPFINKQNRRLIGKHKLMDAESLEDYIALGGMSAFIKALTSMSSDEIIDEVAKSGLKGRGGGGFLTGRKWKSAKNAQPGKKRFVICNADEGDPGAFMDRSILEGCPHGVIEGMLIAAFAIGSDQGYIYVRHEYRLAVQRVAKALADLREMGFLGENILGTDFSFDILINRGGGAFVCGESTALMASIEGKAGEPRPKHIHTVESGLYGLPSNLNNVETYANVPFIINYGANEFKKVGVENSTGTKVFSLTGKVNNTGLVEVPMGITLREIIFDIGGGIKNNKKFKAVQTGGPSGGCLPESELDLSVDFDTLWYAGAPMGSGGMIVMDEENCMVNVAKYFLEFLMMESCGKCTPCREGLRQLVAILDRITKGEGKEGDIELLEDLSQVVIDTSICQLGGAAPFPLLSTLKYFRDEYEAHIKDNKCPAKVCKDLITFSVIEENCTGCHLCVRACPTGAAQGEKKAIHHIEQDKCIKCRLCYEVCRDDAIRIE